MTPEGGSSDDVRRALGSGLMLLAAVVTGGVVAALFSRTVGGLYITIVMPTLAGWLIGAVAGVVGARFGVAERRAAALTVLLGVAIAVAGYHVLAYLSVLDGIAAQTTSFVDRAATDPAQAALAFLEATTGREGIMAYLDFVSTEAGAGLSPVGVIARGGIGLGWTLTLIAIEAAVAITAGLFSVARRVPLGSRRRSS